MALWLKMFKHLLFSGVIAVWGGAIVFLPYGQFWGLLWGVVATILALILRKKHDKIEFESLSQKTFSPHYLCEEKCFQFDSYEESQLDNFYAQTDKSVNQTQGCAFYLMPILGVILALCGLKFTSNLILIGSVVIASNIANILIIMCSYLGLLMDIKEFKSLRLDLYKNIERSAFDIKNDEDCQAIARCYSSKFEARIALTMMKKFKITKTVYPNDALLWAVGVKKLPELFSYFISNGWTLTNITFAQLVNLRYTGTNSLPPYLDKNPHIVEPPPWSPELQELMVIDDDGNYQVVNSNTASLLLSGAIGNPPRPNYTDELFFSYWPNQQEAKIAWVIRTMALDARELSEYVMVYPNDPLTLIIAWDDDDLEASEFITALEQRYQTKFSDEDATKILRNFTLSETINYILSTLNGEKDES